MVMPKVKGLETEWALVIRGDKGYYQEASLSDFYFMVNVIHQFLDLPDLSENRFLEEVENIERVRKKNSPFLDPFRPSSYFTKLEEGRVYQGGQFEEDDEAEFEFAGLRNEYDAFFFRNLLPNGGRFYVDGPHIEYSTPECLSTKTLVAADRAGEAILNLARISLNKKLAPKGLKAIVYKDASDRKGHSYGCHENYLLPRKTFLEITDNHSLLSWQLVSFLVTRQIFAGTGKIDIFQESESGPVVYQISQRADFISRVFSNDTTRDRPIVNLRDEPHADPGRFARLHVVVGEPNLSEFANYLKMGTTAIVLQMIEAGFIKKDLALSQSVRALKQISRDLTCQQACFGTRDGRKLSALNIQEEYYQLAEQYFKKVQEPSPEEKDILEKWQEVLEDISLNNENRLRRRLDWKIKEGILRDFLAEYNLGLEEVKKDIIISDGETRYNLADQLFKKDLLYHNIDEEEGLYFACRELGEVDEILAKEEATLLIKNPPEDCRSFIRGKCLGKFCDQIKEVNWGYLILKDKRKDGHGNFRIFSRTLDLENPLWGSKKDVGDLLESSQELDEFIAKLVALGKQKGGAS